MATEPIDTYQAGVLKTSSTVPIADASANQKALYGQAVAALAGNRAFIAKASPSNAEMVAQVKALSQQVNAVIRLQLGDLGGTD